jgi:DNA topoisomerase-1
MARQLAALGPASSEREIKQNIVQAVKETAQHLGNRPAACRKYYIHPAVFDSYTEQTIFAVMKAAPKGKLNQLEMAVLRIVRSYARAKHPKAS